MAERNWNPSEPYALGLEWPGMRTLALPLSQEVEYGYTFQATATEDIDSATFEIVAPSVNTYTRNTALVSVYKRDNNDVDEAGDEMEYGVVTSTMVAVNGGTLTTASLQNAATIAEALATPSDFKYILVPGGTANLQFATAGLFTGKRILEVKLHFSAKATVLTEPDAVATITITYSGSLLTGETVPIDGAAPVPGVPAPSQVRVISLGEVNYGSGVLPKCWPWTVADVALFDSTTTIDFRHSVGSDYGLDYCALEVVWCEENRVAVGAILMGAGASGAPAEEAASPGQHVAFLRTPAGVDNWTKTADAFYTVTLTSARSMGMALVTRGPAPMIPAVDSFSVFVNHQGRVAPRLPSNVLANVGVDSRITPIRFTTTAALTPTDFAPYDKAVGAAVYAGGSTQTQEIEQRSGGGTVDYPWIRFYARIVGDPTDVPAIDITTADGTMNYFATALLALPEIYDGWREVTLQWPAGQEPGISDAGTDYDVAFTTTQGNIQNRWEILGLDSTGLMSGGNGNATYGGDDTMWKEGATNHNFADLAVTLHTAPPAITGFTVAATTLPLSYIDIVGSGYGNIYGDVYEGDVASEPCFPSAFPVLRVRWDITSMPATEFAYYEIVRTDGYDTDAVVAKLTDHAQIEWYDYEAQYGVSTSYKMRVVRDDGIYGAWTSTASATGTTDGAECGALFFASNTSGDYLSYPEVFEGTAVQEFGFVESGWVQQQHHYGRFGTQSFHPTERGGVRFERTILINALGVPTEGTASSAFQALRDLAWADHPYVCVKDDLGNRWYATLIVPDGNVRRDAQLFLASIQVVESTDVPFPSAT